MLNYEHIEGRTTSEKYSNLYEDCARLFNDIIPINEETTQIYELMVRTNELIIEWFRMFEIATMIHLSHLQQFNENNKIDNFIMFQQQDWLNEMAKELLTVKKIVLDAIMEQQ